MPKLKPDIFTDHFGLVSDFLSECFTQLRNQSRLTVLQNRVFFGGALSGRDINGVNKTISGLLKLIHPGQDAEVSDEDLEWAVRLALEVRRRVKEQQKRIGAAEFPPEHILSIRPECVSIGKAILPERVADVELHFVFHSIRTRAGNLTAQV